MSNSPLIPRRVLFGHPEKHSPRLSPNGRLLAFLAPYEGVLNIWVRTLNEADERLVTNEKWRGIQFFTWRPDSKHILYIQDQDGDENWHLYQLDIVSKAVADLTPFPGIQAQIVAVDLNSPDVIFAALNVRDPRCHDVYRVDLDTGQLDLDTKNPGDILAWSVDNTFQVRVGQARRADGGTEIRIRNDQHSPWSVLQRWSPDETFGKVAGFTPDNKCLWLITSLNANTSRLMEVQLDTGVINVIVEDNQYDVDQVLVNPVTRRLEAALVVRMRSEWQLVDCSLQLDFDVLRQTCDGDFIIENRDATGRRWIVSFVIDDGPTRYYIYDSLTRRADFLFSNRPMLKRYKLAKMRPITFHARDGLAIHGYLTLPLEVESTALPLILLVHGGPWARDVWGLNTVVQWLANRGYAVLQVNFRGSSGYGKLYLNAGDREWGGKMHADLLDAKSWATQQGITGKVCIMGGSYGGYATLVGLSFTPDEFACGIDMGGPSNLVSLLNSLPDYWTPEQSLFCKRVGNVKVDQDFLKARSPLFRAERIKAPLLIAQGGNDSRVTKSESDQIVGIMRENNIPVEYVIFPDEGHSVNRPENVLRLTAAIECFLAQHLGGRAEGSREQE